MLGVKINQFDNSDGTVESFNKIFPKTPLDQKSDMCVEILGITDGKGICPNGVYVRDINIGGDIIQHDFGMNNFFNNEDMLLADNVRFKYYAFNLEGDVLEKAYTAKQLAEKMKCDVGVIKRRLINRVNKDTPTEHLFNVTRIEI